MNASASRSLTDNQRHERLAVLRERCLGCRHVRLNGHGVWQNITAECMADHVGKYQGKEKNWATHCAIASVDPWSELARQVWWYQYASPRLCLAMTDNPCPKYERADQ